MHFLYRPQGLHARQRVTEVFQTGGVGGPNATLVSLPPLQQKVVQQRVCECTWARCVYDPLRSAARLTFHVAFSTATRGQSHHPPPPPPPSHHPARWPIGEFKRTSQLDLRQEDILEVGSERDGERLVE